jgi:hypothetical protein
MDFGTLKIIGYELKCSAHRRSAPVNGKEPKKSAYGDFKK